MAIFCCIGYFYKETIQSAAYSEMSRPNSLEIVFTVSRIETTPEWKRGTEFSWRVYDGRLVVNGALWKRVTKRRPPPPPPPSPPFPLLPFPKLRRKLGENGRIMSKYIYREAVQIDSEDSEVCKIAMVLGGVD